jgi:ABC-2 family transporter
MNLLRTEWLKLKNYAAFWWLMGLTALSYPGMTWIFNNAYNGLKHRKGQAEVILTMLLGNPFSLPEAWHTITYASSIFVFIPAVVVIMFITNEYSYKTSRQNIIDGWSRAQFMLAKMINVFLVSLTVTILCLAVTLIIGLNNKNLTTANKWDQSYYILLFGLQTFYQLSIAFLIGFLIRKAFIALGVFLFYYMILENVLVGLGYFYKIYSYKFLPLEVSDRLIPPPAFWGNFDKDNWVKEISEINYHVFYTIVYAAIIWAICFWVNRRRDL